MKAVKAAREKAITMAAELGQAVGKAWEVTEARQTYDAEAYLAANTRQYLESLENRQETAFPSIWIQVFEYATNRALPRESIESPGPTPTPEDGKALIYVVADGHLTTIFGFDEKWVGAVHSGSYFFVPIDPGEHHVCAMLQSVLPDRSRPRVSVHSLKAEPGGIYYFRTRLVGISTGFVLQLDQLDSDQGRWFVAWSKFSTSHLKD